MTVVKLAESIQAFLGYCRVECGFSPATIPAYGGDLRDLDHWLADQGSHDRAQLNLALIAAVCLDGRVAGNHRVNAQSLTNVSKGLVRAEPYPLTNNADTWTRTRNLGLMNPPL